MAKLIVRADIEVVRIFPGWTQARRQVLKCSHLLSDGILIVRSGSMQSHFVFVEIGGGNEQMTSTTLDLASTIEDIRKHRHTTEHGPFHVLRSFDK